MKNYNYLKNPKKNDKDDIYDDETETYDEDEMLDLMHPNETHEEFMEHEDFY